MSGVPESQQGEAAWPTCPETNERCAWVGGCSQPCAPRQSDVKCPASWVPNMGGPGYQCAKNAGHDGLHDATPRADRLSPDDEDGGGE